MHIRIEIVNGDDVVMERIDLPAQYTYVKSFIIMHIIKNIIKELFL
jgi:hypothetical protein